MNKTYCYKSNSKSEYGKAVKQYLELLPLWGIVSERVSELLGEKITRMATDVEELYIDTMQVGDENRKLFTKDGKLKSNSKKANEVRMKYKEIIEAVGLKDFKDMRLINFIYGVMRTSNQQSLESFMSSEGEIYLKANYDMLYREKLGNNILQITEIEFEEKYLSELKKKEIGK